MRKIGDIKFRILGYPVTVHKLFRRCSYCGGWLAGRGVKHPIDYPKGTKWACMTCEMDFDDE